MTQVIKEEYPESAQRAVSVLASGGLIVYPTETLYGLGADALNEESVGKVFDTKGRPLGRPIPILVGNKDMLGNVGEISDLASELIDKFLPGPLTIVLNQRISLPRMITAGTGKVALRISRHRFVMSLFSLFSNPITSSSANISGQNNIFDFESIRRTFNNRVDLIIDSGTLQRSRGSTVVDLSVSPPLIIREGDISSTLLEEFF